MYKKFVIKYIVPDSFNQDLCTLYLFCKAGDILLPVSIGISSAHTLLEIKRGVLHARPSVYDTLRRSLLGLKAELKCVQVYKVIEDVFYAYLEVVNGTSCVLIDAKFSDAVALALLFECPVLVHSEVFSVAGIKVTQELLNKSLEPHSN